MRAFLKDFIREDKPCFIIGEIAQTHDGSLGTAHAYIDAIADAGASAVKFQTHIAEYESTYLEPWRVAFSYQDESRYAYWKRMEFTREQWIGLKEHSETRGLVFMSSPFSLEAAKMLDEIGMKIWKIPSGEITNYHMLDFVFKTGKPVIFSSGMSNYGELDDVIHRAQEAGVDIGVMQCTSSYPTEARDIGLNIVADLGVRYNCSSGLSDHSGKIFPTLAAITLGATFAEVHVTFDRRVFGPDVSSSVTIEELMMICEGARFIHVMQNNPCNKNDLDVRQTENRRIFNKSIYMKRDLDAGHILTVDDIVAKKPFQGIPASQYTDAIGKRLIRSKCRDEAIHCEDLE